MQTVIRHNNTVVKREGNKILIASYNPDALPFIPDLVLTLTDDEGIDVDQEWVAALKARRIHIASWRQLLADMKLGDALYTAMEKTTPPAFVTSDSQFLSYIEAIANKEIVIPGLAMKGKGFDLLARGVKAYRAKHPNTYPE